VNRLELPTTQWRRVSPKFVVVELVGGVISLLVLAAAACLLFFLAQLWWLAAVFALAALIAIVNLGFIPRRVRAIGYQLRDDDLLFRRGIMWQRFVAVPYGRMQLIDINRGPIARWLGLSELKFVTAAASAGVTIPGLPEAEAEELRDRLVTLAESRRAGL
jgi:membrane protein YdbS with pleckstrin-like domain